MAGPGSAKRWLAARSEPERAALISATAVLVAACLGVTGTIVAGALQARRHTTAAPAATPDPVGGVDSPSLSPVADKGRKVPVNDGYSFDLDSARSNLGMTEDDAAPGNDVTVRLGKPALDLGPGVRAFKAVGQADLSFCEAATAPLPGGIVSSDVSQGHSFCVNTDRGAWFRLKIVKIENDGYPGIITLLINRLTPR